MAVESNKGASSTTPTPGATLTGVPSAAGTGANQTLTGMAAATAAAKGKPRKRSSSLMQIQSSLPSVESSLDEFIARANQTLTDPAQWQAEAVKQQEADEQRREQDALRWKAAEQQLREGDAREQSLRRQLDGLQGRLAEAEARAAVASTTGTNQDGVVADLKIRLQKMEEKLRAADGQAQQAQRRAEELMIELTNAKAQAAAAPAARDSLPSYDNDELTERVRIAEAKAQKAIAAAKAASAGLTVNPADIAAIESGLVVPSFDKPKGTNWGLVVGALVVGAAVMFGVTKLVLKTDAPAQPAAAAAQDSVQPAAAAPAAAPQKPIVTPIEDDKPAAAPANTAAAAPAATAPAAAPVDDSAKLAAEKAAAEKAAADQAAADVAAKKALAEKAAAEQSAAHPAKAPAHQAAPATHHAAKSAPGGGLADPFGGDAAPAPKKAAPKKADKKAGGIVDPF